MSSQLALDFTAPPLAQARAAGVEGARRAETAAARVEPSFREKAEALILQKLARGAAPGEDITDFVRAAGLPMADGRALGATYSSLAKRGLITQVGSCKRRRGHGTAGGIVWALTTPGPVLRDGRGQFASLEAASA